MNNDNFRLYPQQNEWSVARVEGFAAGEIARRSGNTPSRYAMIGIDDYSLGFRAGYFERNALLPSRTLDTAPQESQRRTRTA